MGTQFCLYFSGSLHMQMCSHVRQCIWSESAWTWADYKIWIKLLLLYYTLYYNYNIYIQITITFFFLAPPFFNTCNDHIGVIHTRSGRGTSMCASKILHRPLHSEGHHSLFFMDIFTFSVLLTLYIIKPSWQWAHGSFLEVSTVFLGK